MGAVIPFILRFPHRILIRFPNDLNFLSFAWFTSISTFSSTTEPNHQPGFPHLYPQSCPQHQKVLLLALKLFCGVLLCSYRRNENVGDWSKKMARIPSEWAGFAALRYVLQSALHVPDENWVDQILVEVRFQIGTPQEPQWSVDDECQMDFAESAISTVLLWLGCNDSVIESVIGKFRAKVYEQTEAEAMFYYETIRGES